MSTSQAALVLHPVRAVLLAHHPHKETVTQSLHKTASSASVLVHANGAEGALFAVAVVVLLCILLTSGAKKAIGKG